MRTFASSWARPSLAAAVVGVAVGCGDAGTPEGSSVGAPAPVAVDTLTVDWVRADEAGEVSVELVAGLGDANDRWNFAGFAHGAATMIVPTGARVTLVFTNGDSSSVHSVGVVPLPAGVWSAVPDPSPVFPGAVSTNPGSMSEATAPGESETIVFTADSPGDYALACLVPGHAVAGMWIGFRVEDGAPPAVMTGGPGA